MVRLPTLFSSSNSLLVQFIMKPSFFIHITALAALIDGAMLPASSSSSGSSIASTRKKAATNKASTPVVPKLKSAQVLGLASDSRYNRDSCGSTTFGNRTLWTCRDTQLFHDDGTVRTIPIMASTASWSDFHSSSGNPALLKPPPSYDPVKTPILNQYGDNNVSQAFFPILDGMCAPPAGACTDRTRWAIWPNLPPLVTNSNPSSGHATGYTWIPAAHLNPDLSPVKPNAATILYRTDYAPSSNPHQLPHVTAISPDFWKEDEIPYGTFGTLTHNSFAFLYANTQNNTAALARVPISSIEDKSTYQYYVNQKWTSTRPTLADLANPALKIAIPNANAGAQGTYYFSKVWNSFVWIGGNKYLGANLYITTAPTPKGPWTVPTLFFTGPNGNTPFWAYSIQAHPGLSQGKDEGGEDVIYVSYTKVDKEGYTTPLVRVAWDNSKTKRSAVMRDVL